MSKRRLSFFVALSGLFLLFGLSGKMSAQEATVKPVRDYKYTVSFTPQALLSNSMRIDVERKLWNSSHWLRVGVSGSVFPNIGIAYEPDFFLMFRQGRSFDSMGGVGLEIGYKYLLPFEKEWLYVSAGLLDDFFSIRYHGWEFDSFKEDGLTYWEGNYGKYPQDIYRLGGNLCLGAQTYTYKFVYLDAFVGIGYRYAFFKHEKWQRFDANAFSPGHRGVTCTAGLRIGVRL